jgi:hypothetical protein
MSLPRRRLTIGVLGLGIGLAATLGASAFAPPQIRPPEPARAARRGGDAQVGRTFEVPYRRTLTNHYLVRVRINGKGPFNFLVDTGAPALFIGTEAARQVGIEPDAKSFWTPVDRFEIEGGINLHNLKARIEDPFQLEGMNALGLPGARIDGILGFTILARFRMEFDPTQDRMSWTRLDFNPREPFVPSNPDERRAPPEVQAMSLLGPMMKFMALIIGRQPEDVLHPQGLLGLELAETDDGAVRIAGVLPGTPAAAAGIEAGDVLVRLGEHDIKTLADAHAAIAPVRAGTRVEVALKRGEEMIEKGLVATEGF